MVVLSGSPSAGGGGDGQPQRAGGRHLGAAAVEGEQRRSRVVSGGPHDGRAAGSCSEHWASRWPVGRAAPLPARASVPFPSRLGLCLAAAPSPPPRPLPPPAAAVLAHSARWWNCRSTLPAEVVSNHSGGPSEGEVPGVLLRCCASSCFCQVDGTVILELGNGMRNCHHHLTTCMSVRR